MESQPQEHFINLPLVSTNEESVHLPLVINVVAKYWGEELAPQVIGDTEANRKGTILIDGIELAENHDLASYIYRGSIKDLKRRIDQGIPLIVIMPGIHAIVQHATVVSGYDNEERRIFTYVPEPDAVGAVPESKFEQDWVQDDMTTIVIVPEDMRDIFRNEKLRFAESNRLCFEAERLRQLGNISEATAKLTRATEIDEDNPQVWCLLAGIYNETGSQDSVPYYEKAIGLNPTYYLAYRGLGNHYLKSRKFLLAEGYYSKAIAINASRFGPIYKNRAVARIELGDKVGARADLNRYLDQTPYAGDRKSIEEAMLQL